MARWRFVGSALLIVAMFVASATPASAAIQVRLVVGGPYTFSPGPGARGCLRGLHRLRDGARICGQPRH